MTSRLAPSDADPAVVLTVRADADRLPFARVVAVSCGAQADLPMNRVDDLRQCTQEALAVLLHHGCTGEVAVRFRLDPGSITVHASGSGPDTSLPEPTSFAWLLLDELADDARADLDSGRLAVEFLISGRVDSVPPRQARP